MSPERRTYFYVGLIFVSGLLLGATFMNLAEHYVLHHHAANEYDIRQHRKIAARMGQRLHLSSEQERQVDQVLQDTVQQYQELERHLAPQFDEVRQGDRARLRAILTPVQRVEFDNLVRKVDAEYPIDERPAALSPVPCRTGP